MARSTTTSTSTHLILDGVTKTFGPTTAVDDVSLEVAEGESLVLLGPSGCGKTTTLRLVAGFERPDVGAITLGSRTLASDRAFVPPERRRMSVVFQNYALWPHMTVHDNVAFGPWVRRRQISKEEIAAQTTGALEMVRLGGFGDRYPHQLSGGQQQRIALARALVNRPEALLLDEPLSNLDTHLREEMRFEVKHLQRTLGVTMIYVTHDQAEALSLADRVVVMNQGRIEQAGTPEDLYSRPRTQFVARSLGGTNLLDGRVVTSEDRRCRVEVLGGHVIDVATDTPPGVGTDVVVSVRPGHVRLLPEGGDEALPVAEIEEALFLGESVQYALVAKEGGAPFKVNAPAADRFDPGERVRLAIQPGTPAILQS